LHAWAGSREFVDRFVLNGRNGRKLVTGGPGLSALGAEVDARGADLARISVDEDTVRVRARTGRDRALWSARLQATIGTGTRAYVIGERLDGDRCADLLIALDTGAGGYVAMLDGGTGRTRWIRTVWGADLPFRHSAEGDRNRAC
jgi:hypothetical protein